MINPCEVVTQSYLDLLKENFQCRVLEENLIEITTLIFTLTGITFQFMLSKPLAGSLKFLIMGKSLLNFQLMDSA